MVVTLVDWPRRLACEPSQKGHVGDIVSQGGGHRTIWSRYRFSLSVITYKCIYLLCYIKIIVEIS